MSAKDTSIEIRSILEKNQVDDLQRFLKERRCLNYSNAYMTYVFHFVQSAGILTTSFAAGSSNMRLVWMGVGLNFLATLLNIYEKTNSSILKKLMDDIKLIREGNYVDEGELVDVDSRVRIESHTQSTDEIVTVRAPNTTATNMISLVRSEVGTRTTIE